MMETKYLNLDVIIDLENYRRSLKNWEELYHSAVPTITRESFFMEQFDKYIEIIKPIIYENSMIKDLKKVHDLALFTT
jgi:CRISPR/Cas system-associated protein endoribonuclease Cas2